MAMGWCVLGRSVVAEIWLRQALVQRRERGVWLERQADVISLCRPAVVRTATDHFSM